MTSKEYLEQSARTAYTPNFIYAGIGTAQIGPETLFVSELMHAAMGMVTEAGELEEALGKPGDVDRVNVCEELGDCLWYIALALRALNKTFDDLVPFALKFADIFEREAAEVGDLRWAISGIVTASADLMDQLKKHVIYGKSIDDQHFLRGVARVMSYVMFASAVIDAEMDELCERNIAKLRKRFPDKFNAEQALNRDLDGERAVLERKNP